MKVVKNHQVDVYVLFLVNVFVSLFFSISCHQHFFSCSKIVSTELAYNNPQLIRFYLFP